MNKITKMYNNVWILSGYVKPIGDSAKFTHLYID